MNRTFSQFRYMALMLAFLMLANSADVFAQSRPQRPQTGDGKRNQRPAPKTEEELKKEAEEKRLREEEAKAEISDDIIKVETNLVNIETVVYHKKTGQIVTGLTKDNFAVFEEGKKKDIAAFSNSEAPITVTLILEYSKWSEQFGRASGGWFEPGVYETVRPVAQFLSTFIKPPNDYASVIAFDMRPTPITDFTNDPGRIRQTVDLLLRNQPAFRENNLYDAMQLALVGGMADSVVLENSEAAKTNYAGMVDLKAERKAIILVASGIDTFSRINYSRIRSIVQEAGIPLYIISTGNLYFKKYEHMLGATDGLGGAPGRLTFMQAKNAMNTFAKESGGMHFEMTFPSEVPAYLQTINALLRNQYSLAYEIEEKHAPGKRYKLDVKVDVDGDGNYDDKLYTVQHRPYLLTEKEDKKKKK